MAKDLDFVQRGKALNARRQFQEAAKVCRLGLLGQPTLLEGRLVLGAALLALGRIEEVLGEMRVALDLDARSVSGWLLRGEALSLKGDYAQAEKALLRAQELEGRNGRADKLLADIRTALAAGLHGAIGEEPPETREYPYAQKMAAGGLLVTASAVADAETETDRVMLEGAEVDTHRTVMVDPDLMKGIGQDFVGAEETVLGDEGPTNQVSLPAPRARDLARLGGDLLELDEDDIEDADDEGASAAASSDEIEELSADDYEMVEDSRAIRISQHHPPVKPPPAPAKAQATATPLKNPVTRASRPTGASGRSAAPKLPAARPSVPSQARTPTPPTPLPPSVPAPLRAPVLQSPPRLRPTPPSRRPPPPREPTTNPLVAPPVAPPQRAAAKAGVAPPPPQNAERPRRPTASLRPPPVRRSEGTPIVEALDPPTAPSQKVPQRVAVPVARAHHPTPIQATPIPRALTPPATAKRAPWQRHLTYGWKLALGLSAAAAMVAVVATVTGVLITQYRVRTRIARRTQAAREHLATGTYAGHQAAAEEYRRILADRPDSDAYRAARARILAATAFEFGGPVDGATREVSMLGEDSSEDAEAARLFLALARGDLAKAQRLADESELRFGDARSHYLKGRAALAADRPGDAVTALAAAAALEDPLSALTQHALGLAEAARHHDEAALAAFNRSLAISPYQPMTLIDRATLEVTRCNPEGPPPPGCDRALEAAATSLEAVVSRHAAEAAAAELARAYLTLAELRLGQGKLVQARQMLAKATSHRPDGDSGLMMRVATAHLRCFELAAAEAEAGRVIAAAEGASGGHLLLAQVAMARGEPRAALDHVAHMGAPRADTLLVRALAHLALGESRTARSEIDAALRLSPESSELLAAHARVEIAEGNHAVAARELDRVERTQRGTSNVALAMALAMRGLRQPDRARFWFSKALERDLLALEARVETAHLQRDDGQLEEARRSLDQALAMNAEYLPARRELAALLLDARDPAAAREQLDLVLARRPDDRETLLASARVRLLLGDAVGAGEQVARAQRAGATGEEVLDLEAAALIRSRHPGQAAALLRPLVNSARRTETIVLMIVASDDSGHPMTPKALARLGPPRLQGAPEVVLARARSLVDHGRAALALRLALPVTRRRLVPPTLRAEAFAIAGQAALEQGALRRAGPLLDTATKLDPQSARARYLLAVVLVQQRRQPAAMALLDEAVALDPSLAAAHYELGQLRVAAKDARSKDSFETYLRLDPQGRHALAARRALRAPGDSSPVEKRPPPRVNRRRARGR